MTPPDPTALKTEILNQYASFLGADVESLANLSPEEIERKVNDRMSLYNQKQMGYGTNDSYSASFRNQQTQLNQSLQQVDRVVSNVTDRRQGIRQQAQQQQPNVGNMIRSTVSGMEDRIISKVFRQIQRSFA